MSVDLKRHLERWQAAGLITADQAAAITDFESRLPDQPSGEGQGRGITATEVITYAGALVTLAGLSTLLATQYRQLGTIGRLGIPAVVAVVALVVAWILPRERARARRAQAGLVTLALIAIALFTGQLQVELLGGPDAVVDQHTGYRIGMVTGAVATVLAAGFLHWLRAGLVALAFSLSVILTALFFRLWANVPHGWPTELTFLTAGVLLIVAAELARQQRAAWSAEVLAFSGALVPSLAAFITAGQGNLPLELFGCLIAIVAFVAAVYVSSPGYAFAGGVGVFGFVLDIEFRYFRSSLGFAVSLVIAGLALLGVALLLARLLPRLTTRSTIR